MLLLDLTIFLIALAIIIKSSDYFVEAAKKIAEWFHISSYIIGFTLIAIGTSLPELVSAIGASYFNSPGLIMGDIFGSNAANIGLVLSIGLIIGIIIKVQKRVFFREGIILIISSILFLLFAIDGEVKRIESLILLILFATYSFYILEFNPFKKLLILVTYLRYITYRKNLNRKKASIKERGNRNLQGISKQIAIIILSCGAMIFAVKHLILSAKGLAIATGLSETAIGVTLLAIGTSLPELAVTIVAAKKGMGELILGIIMGSNVSNILLIGGLSGIISPISVSDYSLYYLVPFSILLTLILLAIISRKWQLERKHGILILITYSLFLISLKVFHN